MTFQLKFPGRRNAKAFEAAVSPVLDALYRTALRLVRRHELAEDLVQESLLKGYRFFHTFLPGTNFRAWILRVLYTTFAGERRNADPPSRPLDDAPEPSVKADDLLRELERGSPSERAAAVLDAVDDRIKSAVEDLPEELRAVFLLNTVEDLKYREIADVLGCPLGTVMSRLFRARRMLQDRLSAFAEGPPVPAAGESP